MTEPTKSQPLAIPPLVVFTPEEIAAVNAHMVEVNRGIAEVFGQFAQAVTRINAQLALVIQQLREQQREP